MLTLAHQGEHLPCTPIAQIDPAHALADRAEDFVAQGSAPAGNLLDGQLFLEQIQTLEPVGFVVSHLCRDNPDTRLNPRNDGAEEEIFGLNHYLRSPFLGS